MVVDTHDRIHIFLAEGTHQVVGTLLHLRVSTLNGIQLNTIAVATCIDGRHRTATESDAVVITTDDDHLITLLGLLLQTVALGTITHTTSQHDDLVVSVFCIIGFLMLEGQYGTADQRLTELITEITGTIRSLDQNLFRGLVQPLTNGQNALPIASQFVIVSQTRICRHIDCCTSNRPRTYATAHTVADLTARTSSRTVEWLHGGGEVMRLCLQRDDTLDIFYLEPVAGALVFRCELLNDRTLCKSHIILIGRENLVGIFLSGLFDHRKKT